METKELWPGGPLYAGEALQLDAAALADFARSGREARCADLGCGSGILMLLLAWEQEGLCLDGIDLRGEAVEAAEANFRRNGLEGRCRARQGDLRGALLPRNHYDLVVSNPPYFAPGAGKASPDRQRALSRQESASPAELCTAAASLLKSGGRFCAVYRPERLPELLAAMSGAGLAPKRLRCVSPRPEAKPALVLCEGRKGGRPGLDFLPPLLVRGADGRESGEYRRITHWEERTDV